jgi:simple sugar transport system permease protein
MTMGLPSAIAPMLQGIILFCVLGGDILTRYRIRWSAPAPSSPAPGAADG